MHESSAEKAIFQAALFISGKGERDEFLNVACQENRDLRLRVELLLEMAESSGSFMRKRAIHSIVADTQAGESSPETPSVDLSAVAIETATASLAGQTLGPYRIESLIGAGGMGDVYRARDVRMGREVALKVLPERVASDPVRQARFDREVRAVAALSHPNILAIHDCGTHGSVTYAVMELLEGETLKSRLAKGPLPWREASEIGAAVAEGLAAAHAKGIVHRDLKPDNLFLTADGRVKILDFGLARLDPRRDSQTETATYVTGDTDAGTVLGTVGYMSPEQVRGQPADARSDIFSFGCVLYEMVTGLRAFRRDSAAETLAAILHDEPPERSDSGSKVPGELSRLIRQCLAKNSNQRLQSARDLALGLRAVLGEARLHGVTVAHRRSRVFAGAAVSLLSLGVIGASLYFSSRGDRFTEGNATKEVARPIEAIAVLPFENLTGDPDLDYLSVSLADHLINSLSRIRRQNLQVRPFPSVARYRQVKANAPTIGSALNVEAIVTGTISKLGNEPSISVSLVDTHTDNVLWSSPGYSGSLKGILESQVKIAREVASHLHLDLTAEEEERVTKRYTDSQEAHDLYNKAVYEFNKFTRDGLERAIELCNQAIEKDQQYALAHVWIARCYILLGTMHVGPRQTFEKAKVAVAKAEELDDTLPEIHGILGAMHLWLEWNWSAAESELRQAIPSGASFPVYNLYGFYHAANGRLPEAFEAIETFQRLDPNTAARKFEVAMCYNWMGLHDKAIVECLEAIKLDRFFFPTYAELGLAYALTKRFAEAEEALRKGLELANGHPGLLGMLGFVHVARGKTEEADQVLRTLRAGADDNRFGCAHAIARIYAGRGDKAQAFEWLERACHERHPQVIWLKVDPTLATLRGHERFTGLLEKLGLPTD